ncbi:valine--pyruvate transaminase [Fontisphaera persica]|uniref:valine--pyruvate transaminase n=1 Tax=Fontisphaera persica TaxID=2974023 RepID=UPI0024BF9023|nr:valine--pyruvate transaminase [Fontisphaera persica]WCJ60444.1 valine--pyruvate transaminase [Fontisphaera persica]
MLNPDVITRVGAKLSQATGIWELMEDLGHALTVDPDMRMLGGGNPAMVPEFTQAARQRLKQMLEEPETVAAMLGNYDPPRGHPRFIEAFAALLRRTYGWPVQPEHVAITPGSQCATFFLINLFAGQDRAGKQRKILLPLCPEYLGYADQGLEPDIFVACRPKLEWIEGPNRHLFKYHIDLAVVEERLRQGDIAAMLISRPTNPSGNVLADDEIRALSGLASQFGIPIILDQAYGVPFPAIVYTSIQPVYAPHFILLFSLSKIGLPGTRTGIVVGPAEVTAAVASLTAVAGLANPTLGQQMVLPWIEDGSILEIGPRWLQPFYNARRLKAREWLHAAFERARVPWAMHADEGAFFHWLWLPELKISSREFCQRLKERKVLTVPGEYFFYGLEENWTHRHQCLRINYSGHENVVREAVEIIADEAAQNQR